MSMVQREARLRDSGQTSLLDMFGEEVPMPLEEVRLEGGDALPREKVAWEKEFLGVPLSENPMSILAFKNNTEAISSRDQIDASMDGQRINLVGQISSTAERMTRKGGTFVVGTLELLGGSIETIAWPDVYEQTRDLWQEGSLISIVGKVRERDGEVSVHCDEVKPFRIEGPGSGGPSASPRTVAPPAVVPEVPAPTSQQVLLIRMVETGRPDEDSFLVHEVLRTCLEFPGRDRVNMEIRTNNQLVLLDVPIVSTSYCEELHLRLEKLIGTGRLKVLNGSGNGNKSHR